MSRSSVQAWQKDPSVGFGWAGKLSGAYPIIVFGIAIMLLIPFIIKATREKLVSKILYFVGLIIAGSSFKLFIWFIYSNCCITDTPKECSFAFNLPISLVLTFIILRFCPIQPEKKWRGLTFSTAGEDIILNK